METIIVSKIPLKVDDILYLKSELNYTRFYLTTGKLILSSFTLKVFECQLPDAKFKRINRGVLVNINFIKDKQENRVILKNDVILKISRRRRSTSI